MLTIWDRSKFKDTATLFYIRGHPQRTSEKYVIFHTLPSPSRLLPAFGITPSPRDVQLLSAIPVLYTSYSLQIKVV